VAGKGYLVVEEQCCPDGGGETGAKTADDGDERDRGQAESKRRTVQSMRPEAKDDEEARKDYRGNIAQRLLQSVKGWSESPGANCGFTILLVRAFSGSGSPCGEELTCE